MRSCERSGRGGWEMRKLSDLIPYRCRGGNLKTPYIVKKLRQLGSIQLRLKWKKKTAVKRHWTRHLWTQTEMFVTVHLIILQAEHATLRWLYSLSTRIQGAVAVSNYPCLAYAPLSTLWWVCSSKEQLWKGRVTFSDYNPVIIAAQRRKGSIIWFGRTWKKDREHRADGSSTVCAQAARCSGHKKSG